MSDTIDELVDDPMLRQRLEHHLERTAEGVEIRRTPMTAVVRRADVRRRRQRAAAALGAVCLVVAAVGAAVAGRSDDRTIVNVDEPPTLSTDSRPSATLGAPGTTAGDAATTPTLTDDKAIAPISSAVSTIFDSLYEWQTITPDESTREALDLMVSSSDNDRGTLGWTYDQMSSPGWVSTVFVSNDGTTWGATPTNPGLSVVGGIDTAGAIHIVGYASSADPDAGKVFVATSDDRGATWRRDPLPYDLSPAWASDAVSEALYPSEVAAVDGTVVVAIQHSGMLQPSVHVSGPIGYTEVDVPFANASSVFRLSSTSTSILAVEALTAAARVYETTDGRSWRLVGEIPLQTYRASWIGDRYVVVGADLESGETMIASSTDGEAWTVHPLWPDASGATWNPLYDMIAVDDDTLAMAASEVLEPQELRLTKNGVTMIFDAGLSDIRFVDDATGDEIGRARDGERTGPVRLDDGPILSVLDGAGDVRVQFSLEEATAVMQSTPGPVQRVAIYTTDDLTTWSRTILNDVVTDGNVTLNAVDLVDDRVIVRVGVDRDGDPATFESDPFLVGGTRIR